MAKRHYSPDSGRNSHPSASMTCVDDPVQYRALSVANSAIGAALAAAGHTSAVATKAASFINVTPNN